MDERPRPRVLFALLCGLIAWFVWGEQRRASEDLAAEIQAQTQFARAGAATAEQRERRRRLHRVVERLAERTPPPTSVAAVREFLLQAADSQGVELSQSRLQPLVRTPAGTLGAEARVTLLGDPASLSRFLAVVEGTGWPLRTERATLAVRGGLGTLTATAFVWWPDPATSFTVADADQLAGDPDLERLFAWLESTATAAGPERAASAAAAAPGAAPPPPPLETLPEELIDTAPEAVEPPRPAPPELHGFVDVGSGTPVRAALFYRGETALVGVGDRIGEYTVVTLEPPAAVVLSRGEGPPLRLVLR